MKTRHIVTYVTMSLVAALVLVSANFAHAQSAASTYSNSAGIAQSTTTSGTETLNTTSTTSTSTRGTTRSTGATGTSSATTTTPGLPNTGAGGMAATNLAILLASGIVIAGGSALLARRYA